MPQKTTKFKSSRNFSGQQLLALIAGLSLIGAYIIFRSHAATAISQTVHITWDEANCFATASPDVLYAVKGDTVNFTFINDGAIDMKVGYGGNQITLHPAASGNLSKTNVEFIDGPDLEPVGSATCEANGYGYWSTLVEAAEGSVACTASTDQPGYWDLQISYDLGKDNQVSLFDGSNLGSTYQGGSGGVMTRVAGGTTDKTFYLRNGNTGGAPVITQGTCPALAAPPTDGGGGGGTTITEPPKTAPKPTPQKPAPSGGNGSTNSSSGSSKPAAETPKPTAPADPKATKVAADSKDIDATKPIEIEQSKPLVISGKTTPNATVNLFIFSEPRTASTTADKDGNWSYTLTGLAPGSHRVEAQVTDPATKLTSGRVQLLAFTVKAAAVSTVNPVKPKAKLPMWALYTTAAVVLGAIGFAIARFRKRPI